MMKEYITWIIIDIGKNRSESFDNWEFGTSQKRIVALQITTVITIIIITIIIIIIITITTTITIIIIIIIIIIENFHMNET
jgi:hypothetical protein